MIRHLDKARLGSIITSFLELNPTVMRHIPPPREEGGLLFARAACFLQVLSASRETVCFQADRRRDQDNMVPTPGPSSQCWHAAL